MKSQSFRAISKLGKKIVTGSKTGNTSDGLGISYPGEFIACSNCMSCDYFREFRAI